MTKAEFNQSMQRVVAFMPRPKGDRDVAEFREYMEALFEMVQAWPAFEFDTVSKELVKRITIRGRPDGRSFVEVRRQLQDEGRSKREFSTSCESCLGTNMVLNQYRRISTGEELTGARPCPKCRSRQYQDWPIKDDLELVG